MNLRFTEPVLRQLSSSVASRFGLAFPPQRWGDLERAVQAACPDTNTLPAIEHLADRVLDSSLDPSEFQALVQQLTISETYFLREWRALALVAEQIAKERRSNRWLTGRAPRIWSAGCATGEEPFSIAIIVERLFPELKDLAILATDLNASSLARALNGTYGDWSFREAAAWLKLDFFEKAEERRWSVRSEIRNKVSFRYLNLMDGHFPSPWNGTQDQDLIVCRNVLMYCTPEAAERIVGLFSQCLNEGGWLVVGAAEVSLSCFADFDSFLIEGITLYRKRSHPPANISDTSRVTNEIAVSSYATPALAQLSPATTNSKDQESPDDTVVPITVYNTAFAHYQKGDYIQAELLAADLMASGSPVPAAALLLARIYANRGQLQKALTHCEMALAGNKMDLSAHYLRAHILQELDMVTDAVQSLRHALYVDPQFVLGYFSLGTLAERHDGVGDPAKYYETALDLLSRCNPTDILPESDGLLAADLRAIVLRRNPRSGTRECRSSDCKTDLVAGGSR